MLSALFRRQASHAGSISVIVINSRTPWTCFGGVVASSRITHTRGNCFPCVVSISAATVFRDCATGGSDARRLRATEGWIATTRLIAATVVLFVACSAPQGSDSVASSQGDLLLLIAHTRHEAKGHPPRH